MLRIVALRDDWIRGRSLRLRLDTKQFVSRPSHPILL